MHYLFYLNLWPSAWRMCAMRVLCNVHAVCLHYTYMTRTRGKVVENTKKIAVGKKIWRRQKKIDA